MRKGLLGHLVDDILSALGIDFPVVEILAGCVALWFIIAIVRYFIKGGE